MMFMWYHLQVYIIINDIDYVHLCARVSVYTPVHMYVCT